MEMEKLRNQDKYLIMSILLIMLFLNIGCSSKFNQKYIQNNLGIKANLKEQVYLWNSGMDAQSEGYEISIYKYESKSVDALIDNGYPIVDEDKKSWLVFPWKNTPSIYSEEFELIFNYKIENIEAKKNILELKKLMNDNNNFYSYYYSYAQNTSIVSSIELYLLDTKKNLIYRCIVRV